MVTRESNTHIQAMDSVIAFDPGGTTGVAGIRQGKVVLSVAVSYDELLNQLSSSNKSSKEYADAVEYASFPIMVVEDFRLYPWKAKSMGFDRLPAVRVIGALELFARANGQRFVLQPAEKAKRFFPDEALALLGWTEWLTNVHKRDAGRHAAYYLWRLQTYRETPETKRAAFFGAESVYYERVDPCTGQ